MSKELDSNGPVIMTDDSLPLVSVITPAYNQAYYLVETVESVLSQDYPHIEYIVLNDGSTDDTDEVLKKYNGRLIWETHPNMGETLTVNKGVAMARGDIIVVVNSDDLLLPGAVGAAVEFMQAHPAIIVGYPDWDVIDEHSRFKCHVRVPEYDYVRMVKCHHCLVGPGAFIRKTAFEMAGLRDPDFRYVADFELWLRLGLFGQFARIPGTLAAWREHPSAASQSCKGPAMSEEHIRIMQKYYSRTDIPADVRRVRAEAFCRAHITAALTCGTKSSLIVKHCLLGFISYPPAVLANFDKVPAGLRAIVEQFT